MNSKSVFKFSGLGLVTKMLEYPCASAAAIASPSAADFPRPRAAVKVTVDESVFSAIASTNVNIARAWSSVFASLTSSPTGFVSANVIFSSFNSECSSPFARESSSMGVISLPFEIGRTLSSSSRTKQSEQEPRERIKRSLKRAITESWAEVR